MVVVGHLEQAARNRELAAGRQIDIAAPDADARGASGDAHIDVGVLDRRQAVDRADFGAVAGNLDRKAVVRNGRADRS